MSKKQVQLDSDAIERAERNPNDYDLSTQMLEMIQESPIPENEKLRNLFLFMDRRMISRLLFMNELYQKMMHLHGSIFEFGVRYGVNEAIWTSLRGIYEPFNHNRKIVGFDSFEGFLEISEHDKADKQVGGFGVVEGYEDYLAKLLALHEKMAPVEAIQKFQLVKGDAIVELQAYLENHQETIVSFAYFDFDLYEPTLQCLQILEPYLAKGAVIGFDELNVEQWPGETKALRDWLGDRKMSIRHSPFRGAAAYLIYGE